jgi:hypothetical protein
MHEVQKGVYATQVWDVPEKPEHRLDCALRLWSCGIDVEIDQATASGQEYNQVLWKAPAAWEMFTLPSFGRV